MKDSYNILQRRRKGISHLDHMMSESSLRLIQRCVSLVPVIVLGSGASSAYGFAGMSQLAAYLAANVAADPDDEARWEPFKAEIQSGTDLETAMLKIPVSRKLEQQIIRHTRELILGQDREVFHRIVRNDIRLPLGELLRYFHRTANQSIKIVTTNYDRLAEYAADQASLNVDNGFGGQYRKTFRGFRKMNVEAVELLKVHGSLDWFVSEDVGVVGIPDHLSAEAGMSPLMVAPGAGKYEHTHNEPFRSIISRADAAFEAAHSILCIGYGFNDNHIHPKLVEKMRQGRTPIMIVTKKLSPNAVHFIERAAASNVFGIEEHCEGTRIVFFDREEVVEGLSFWSFDDLIRLVM